MLINLSNHPFAGWSKGQQEAATIYGKVVDMDFPDIDPNAGEEVINELCNKYLSKCLSLFENTPLPHVVHIMGEMTLCYALIKQLQQQGITCIASTTIRIVEENGNEKKSVFQFCKFRKYLEI